MSIIRAVLAVALTCTAATVPAAAQTTPSTPAPAARATAAPGDAASGKRAFQDYVCYYCHGSEGQGSAANVGPRIATTPRSLDSFVRYVRRPAGRMSAYPDAVVSDAVLADIYAFLKAIPPPKKAADLPGLQKLRPR